MGSKVKLYSLCFLGLCVIDQIRNSQEGTVQLAAVNCTGLIVAVLILTAYKLRDFKKPVYPVWILVSVLGQAYIYLRIRDTGIYQGQVITGMLNVTIYGIILIRLFYKLVIEKEIPKLHWWQLVLFSTMLLFMAFSRNRVVWPIWFLAMFGSFYLTDYNREQMEAVYDGMLNGIIMGFFCIQGEAFVFRPYDVLRYSGMYANGNMTALFYTLVYGAFLGKCYRLRKLKKSKFWEAICIFFAGSMFMFVLLTMGRTALLTMVAETLLYLFLITIKQPNKIRIVFYNGLGLALSFAISIPLVFGCVRYLPAVFHHPIWFYDEYSEERVHSWDPYDSEKYIDFDEFWDASLGRLFWFIDMGKEQVSSLLRPGLIVQAASDSSMDYQADTMSGENLTSGPAGSSKENPVLIQDPGSIDPITIRKTIHQYYLQRLNLMGHGKEEQTGFWLTSNYLAPHAHNIFIDIAYNYGAIAGILFLLLVVFLFIRLFIVTLKTCDFKAVTALIFLTVIVVFGMFEIDWRIGQLPFTLLFLLYHPRLEDI